MCRVNNRRCHNIWDRAALRRSGGLSGAQDAVNLSRAYRFLTSCAPVAKNDTPLPQYIGDECVESDGCWITCVGWICSVGRKFFNLLLGTTHMPPQTSKLNRLSLAPQGNQLFYRSFSRRFECGFYLGFLGV
jgi:hypothetical protein